jgi:imidazolonepropionase-like amidohydrolase
MHRTLPSLLLLVACGGRQAAPPQAAWFDPESTTPPTPRRSPRVLAPPKPVVGPEVVLRHATILTATGTRIEDGAIVLRDGKIAALGPSASIPAGARELDLRGKFVTPGIIDTHSHLGVYAAPEAIANEDGNEATNVFTPAADAAAGYYPQDPQISRALAGGVTVAQILPGSANLIGGTSVVVEMRLGRTVDEVAFPGAKRGIKMACGENPKRVYGGKTGPQTRMGLYPALRKQLERAREYRGKRKEYAALRARWEEKQRKRQKPEPAPPMQVRDDDLEVLSAVLDGEILVHVHCYRASDQLEMLSIADDFGYQIRSFHHALETYKIRDRIAPRGIALSTWADWWGFKLEAWDGIPENAALYHEAGGRAVIHSDSAVGIQRLNQEAAKALSAGLAAGVELDENDALRWITVNAAWALGIDDVTGTLEVGKRADVVVWSGPPLSVYARAERVYIAGRESFVRDAGRAQSDFELGNAP